MKNEAAKGLCRKTKPEFCGPYRIIKLCGERTVRLKNEQTGKVLQRTTHINRIKRMELKTEEQDTEIQEEQQIETIKGQPATGGKQGKSKTVKCKKPEVQGKNGPEMEGEEPGDDSDSGEWVDINTDDQRREKSERYYEVDRILGIRKRGNQYEYLVKWMDRNNEGFKPTWEKSENLTEDSRNMYHEKFTKDGKIRKKYKKKKRITGN